MRYSFPFQILPLSKLLSLFLIFIMALQILIRATMEASLNIVLRLLRRPWTVSGDALISASSDTRFPSDILDLFGASLRGYHSDFHAVIR